MRNRDIIIAYALILASALVAGAMTYIIKGVKGL